MAQAAEVVDELQPAREAAEERRLVAAAVAGSTAAFEQLYRRHSRRVYALCLRMTGNVATAEDCTQDAFVQAWRSLARFESRSAFGTWLHRIAVNAVLQQGRRRGEVLGDVDSIEREVADYWRTRASPTPAAAATSRPPSPDCRRVRDTCWCWWDCTAIRTRRPRSCSGSRPAPARRNCTGRGRCWAPGSATRRTADMTPDERTLQDADRADRRAVADLPLELEPRRDLWPDIAARLEQPAAPVAAAPRGRPAWLWQAAAAVVLVAGSSLLTARLLDRPTPAGQSAAAVAAAGCARASTVPSRRCRRPSGPPDSSIRSTWRRAGC